MGVWNMRHEVRQREGARRGEGGEEQKEKNKEELTEVRELI